MVAMHQACEHPTVPSNTKQKGCLWREQTVRWYRVSLCAFLIVTPPACRKSGNLKFWDSIMYCMYL